MAAAAVANGLSPRVSSMSIGGINGAEIVGTSTQTLSSTSKVASSRGRRERPCDACRKRKSKCVITEGQQSCAACAVHGQQCTYIEDPQPRKRRLNSDGKEADTPKRRSTISLNQDTPILNSATRTGSEPNLHYGMTDMSRQATQEVRERPPQQYSTHIGPTTELEPFILDLSSAAGAALPGDLYRKSDKRTSFLVDRFAAEGSKAAKVTALSALERLIGSCGPVLVQSYLSIIHRNFPILEDDFFSEYNSGSKFNIDPALLATVYLITVPLVARELSRSSSQLPDIYQLEDLAFRLFAESLYKPTLSTVQTGILLLQRPNNDSKTLNSQIVGAAYELGLHLDCTTWATSAIEKASRKRVAWALYMQDKWCSLIHGRPSVISKSNWAVRNLVDQDFVSSTMTYGAVVSEEEVDRGRALFKEMVNLTEILSTILDTFYTLKAMKEVDEAVQNGTRLILERAKPVQIRLKEWFAGLSPNLKMDSTMTGRPSSTGYLHLAYFATEITLHRCIIRSLETSNGDPYLTHICRSAAKTRLISAMDFVNRLRPEHMHAFWYFPSKVNFALIGTFGCLLLATAPYNEEVDFYRTRLSEYRWTLSVSSKTIHFLSFALNSLDSSSALLKNLPIRPPASEVLTQIAAIKPTQHISPTQDEIFSESPQLYLGSLPVPGSNNSAAASGLVSPSTSTSSGSTTYDAYVEMFPTNPNR